MTARWSVCRRCCAPGGRPTATTLDRCPTCRSSDLVPLTSHEGLRIAADVDRRMAEGRIVDEVAP